ncbi:TetR family transcriptional regulator C-terminal domain-containing protein [Xinfangfangia sp. CPCC 101601]|uniref:TetR family transcriptional regulator C-terminal domain-containing protein n=1 Tax=Pseudogemmobacter lacusdianii TaxID=3069608 RepID=A0ABU0VSQ6_9RHOB|nr:TetR family transcriptional regulator C-terminal domain-containing protein [Xinfangfangia sp. CPCC 101601]MDQ2064764.1 TetR family transcriptional regulator C-terminal domain-containing protein [Xinfangfangia sp. CPCC 101601]
MTAASPKPSTSSAEAPDPAPRPRTMSREARREQIIEATIRTLAARGFARTTLTEVAREAGLSHGLVLFHFETKEKLLADTLGALAEEYRDNWQAALASAGPTAAEQLSALIDADFAPNLCTPDRLAAWCAFWGEAQSRPIYQENYGDKDAAYNARMEEICAELVAEGGYTAAPKYLARILRLTIEGTWLDLMSMKDPYDAAEAQRTARICASILFPKHFKAE